jgi:hypothetical protein
MAMRNRAKVAAAFLLMSSVTGCGTYVPELRDWPNGNDVAAAAMVVSIVHSVRCELQQTITNIVNHDIDAARTRASRRTYTDFLNDWGAQVAFTFTIVEKSGVNPAGLWAPVTPASAVFTLGGDLNLSSQATRMEKLNFIYRVKDLYMRPGQTCSPGGDPSASFLIKNDLKIGELLDLRIAPVVTGQGPGPIPTGDKNVLQHQITFQVVSSGGLTPSWQLVRGSINQSGTFLSGSRDRTHDLLITFGPLDKRTGGKSLIGIAEATHISSQLSSGLGAAFRTTLGR